jgi:hypothetical protein
MRFSQQDATTQRVESDLSSVSETEAATARYHPSARPTEDNAGKHDAARSLCRDAHFEVCSSRPAAPELDRSHSLSEKPEKTGRFQNNPIL